MISARRRDAVAPELVVAGPDQQTMEPGVESVGVAQPPDVSPGFDERVLQRVLGAIRVAEDQPCRRVQASARAMCEDRERLPIAQLRPRHELRLHHRPAVRDRSGRASTGYVVIVAAQGSIFAQPGSGSTSRLQHEGGQWDRVVAISAGDEHPTVEQERRGGAIAERDRRLEWGRRARRRIEPWERRRWRRTSRRRAAIDRPGARTGSGPGSRPRQAAGTCRRRIVELGRRCHAGLDRGGQHDASIG